MSMKMLLKTTVLSAAACLGFAATATAQAVPCEITELSSASKATDLYLKAENELIVNDNPQAAIALINEMRKLELNCLEEGSALGISAQVKITLEDYQGAIADLKLSLDKGYIPADRRTNIIQTVAQLYFQEGDLRNGLDYMNRWIAAGGKPTRDQMFTMGQVNYNLEKYPEALSWVEKVFAIDGPGAERVVYDFLIDLYNKTGNKAKRAQLLEQLLQREPGDRRIWDQISSDYYQANDDRAAFEVQKAMYLGGILTKEDELLRIVNFYNRFDVPLEAAKILEKEMNAGRIDRTLQQLDTLANLYQLAREHKRAIPVVERAAKEFNAGSMYERLARSYSDLQEWDKAEAAMREGLRVGGVKDVGLAWVTIGQARYEQKDREGARESFRKANNAGGRGWLAFMAQEDQTARDLKVFNAQREVIRIENEQKNCEKLKVIGNLPEACNTVEERLTEAQAKLDAI